jgi:hypothetical protein
LKMALLPGRTGRREPRFLGAVTCADLEIKVFGFLP